ncbi:MAG: ATP-binding protein [Chlamydiae bacterium]|nr:ATP-binding protein [Chlamydiota bacterium]
MKFYDRKKEREELSKLWEQADETSKMAVVTGRRRLGKTLLVTEFAKGLRSFYFFVEKKPEALLCQDYLAILREKLPFPIIGEISRFKDILHLLFTYAEKEKLLIIVDEFQEFFTVNPSVYSEVQNLWDTYRARAKVLFIAIGSVFSLMHKIFEQQQEPLFGRADRILQIAPFSIQMLATVLEDYLITDVRDLFDFYVITGGVPKYLDILMSNHVKSLPAIIDFLLSEYSPLLDEGRHLLTLEFGKEYGTYFAILELISMGKTSRSEIESVLGYGIGGYIERLEKSYSLLYRVVPIQEKASSQRVKFGIKDPFLQFWFYFIYRNSSAVELKNFTYIRRILDRDYTTYSGRLLERFFRELVASTNKYNRVGSYWEKKNLNEIDIVAINDLDRELFLAEVKRNPQNYHPHELQNKAQNLLKEYPSYKVEFVGLSLEDAKSFLDVKND